jgi:DNA-binding response OmpR family regulator
MNGFDVCYAVKREMKLDTYVIMLTAKGQEFDKQRGEEVGADIYMTKPFDPDELLHKAQHILRM